MAFFCAGELLLPAGPVDGVDYFDSACSPAFGGDVVHFVVEDFVSFGVEDEWFLVLAVSRPAPDEDFVGVLFEFTDGGVLGLLLFEVTPPDGAFEGYYLDLVCAFFEHDEFEAGQFGPDVRDEDAVGVVAAFDCAGD